MSNSNNKNCQYCEEDPEIVCDRCGKFICEDCYCADAPYEEDPFYIEYICYECMLKAHPKEEMK